MHSGHPCVVWTLALLVMAVGFAAPLRAADSLSDLRSEARTADPDDRSAKKEPSQEDCRPDSYSDDDPCDGIDDDDDTFWESLFAPVFAPAAIAAGTMVSSPFWGPPLLIGDGYDRAGYFPEYPYQYERGYMMVDYVDLYEDGEARERYSWAWRARPDYGTNFSGIQWVGGNVLVETTARIGMETDFRFLQEDLSFGQHDSLWLGDANAFWRFAQSDQTQMRAGVGFNYLADEFHADFGFNFTYAIDWYPVQPLVISAEMDVGSLNEATLFHVRTTAGLTWRGAEAFVGYDLYDIDHFQAQGMVAGIRLWF
jgi:hypothetical protein